jgi:hypothetical protein
MGKSENINLFYKRDFGRRGQSLSKAPIILFMEEGGRRPRWSSNKHPFFLNEKDFVRWPRWPSTEPTIRNKMKAQ